jgi:hypothetical protein
MCVCVCVCVHVMLNVCEDSSGPFICEILGFPAEGEARRRRKARRRRPQKILGFHLSYPHAFGPPYELWLLLFYLSHQWGKCYR